jgi:hypothetical protein
VRSALISKVVNHRIIQANRQQLGIVTQGSILLTSVTGTFVLLGAAMALGNPTQGLETAGINQVRDRQLAVQPQVNTSSPANTQLAQAQLTDISGSWAEPFIKTLADKGIIFGYPDGTYRPDQPVTRAEFAALLNKAFDLQPTRSRIRFKDVPKKFWGAEVINKAYESGFMAGYPNGTFAPKQNIIRIQALVAMVNGTKLQPDPAKDTKDAYRDTDQVPSYGREALIAATQRCVAVSQEYPTDKTFNPQKVATRADVAALLHQILVSSGKLPALAAGSPAQRYVAGCDVAVTPTPAPTPTAQISNEQAIQDLSIKGRIPESTAGASGRPVGGVNTPTAFGSGWGTVFIGTGYQATTRPDIFSQYPLVGAQGKEDGAVSLGFGLGDPLNAIALETVINSNSTFRTGIGTSGAVSFKLHKQLNPNFAIAAGFDNAINLGNVGDGGQTGYGVASMILNPSAENSFFSNTTVSIGAGGGRFRSVADIATGKDNIQIFGGIGTRLSPNFSLAADWNGQDLNIGLPIDIPLSSNLSLSILPSISDLINKETGGSRFVVSGGLGLNF